MRNARLMALIRKEFIQIIRDPRALVITFLLPVIMLLMLGYAATNDVRNVELGVWDQDNSPASRAFIEAYQAADYFKLEYRVGSEDELRTLMDSNRIRVGMIIPPDFSRSLASGTTARVAFVLDGSDPTMAGTAIAAAQLIGGAQSTRVLVQTMNYYEQAGTLSTPIEIRTQVWYNPGMVSAHFMIPGLVGMILQFLTTFLTATSIVRERERGTIEQLIVTPLKPWELVVGKITPYVLIAFLDMLEVLFVGMMLFEVPINGSLLLLLLLSALFLVTTLGIGLLISTVANTQQEAMLVTMLTVYPSIFLSGFFFPLAAMPKILQWISYAVPVRYFLIITRGILLKGVGMESIWLEVLALCIFSVVMMSLAALRFRKRLD